MNLIKTISFLTVLISASLICACSDNRQIVPNDSDTADVFEPLYPNEDENPEEPTYGDEHIPGFITDYRIPTENDEIYLDINLTLLTVNPEIVYNLFDFISEELKETGFINEKAEFPALILNESEDERERLQNYSAQRLDNYKTLFNEQLPVIETFRSPFNMAIDIYPVFLNDDYITYRKYDYYYTGGAHGNSKSFLTTFNLTSGKAIGLEEIVKPESMDHVREMVAAHMAYSYPIYENLKTVDEYIDSLNVWLGTGTTENESKKITLKNYPLENPAISSKGLVFCYERYELAPGVDGSPVVVLPYDEVRDCLKPPFNGY